MSIVLILSIYMVVILVIILSREYKKDPKAFSFDKVKLAICDAFFILLFVHIPLFIMGCIILVLRGLNVWRLHILVQDIKKVWKRQQLVKTVFKDLLLSITWFFGDYLFTPFFFLSFLQVWNLPTIIRIYKKHLLGKWHYWIIWRSFWSMTCSIFVMILRYTLMILSPWRIPTLLSCLWQAKVVINKELGDDEKEVINATPLHEEEFKTLLFVFEQILKDCFVIPIVILLLASIVHAPLAVKVLSMNFATVELNKRRELESERRFLLWYCLKKILIECLTLLILVLCILVFWRIPFLLRASKIRVSRLKPAECSQETKETYSKFY
eukprot:TRINITY_DN2461_c0_g1_i1.p5 TRINITY_DN2461_c0_g1~~TRINITY_DN2461_c0_g1_i1.p5  ORF type:complete len:325 (-),score=18.28 TRINITY_DN2461_c0_g1_i1:3664-4638(-)